MLCLLTPTSDPQCPVYRVFTPLSDSVTVPHGRFLAQEVPVPRWPFRAIHPGTCLDNCILGINSLLHHYSSSPPSIFLSPKPIKCGSEKVTIKAISDTDCLLAALPALVLFTCGGSAHNRMIVSLPGQATSIDFSHFAFRAGVSLGWHCSVNLSAFHYQASLLAAAKSVLLLLAFSSHWLC